MKTSLYTLLFLFILSMQSLYAADIYVTEAGAGNQDGTDWGNAYAGGTLYNTIANANAGDNIHVGAGTYKPIRIGVNEFPFPFKAGVKVYGGYPASGGGARDWNTNVTILSGDINGDDLAGDVFVTPLPRRSDNIGHVLSGTGNIAGALYDGFTIKGGGRTGIAYGGGVHLRLVSNAGADPILNNMIVEDCFAGAGAAITNESSRKGTHVTGGAYVVSISNVTIRNNKATGAGGGIFNTTADMVMSDIHLNGNSAGTIGGAITNAVSTVVMTGITANNNTSGTYGGGIVNTTATATMSNITLTNNIAGSYGGGIVNTTAKVVMNQAVITGNRANGGDGGGIYNTTATSDSSIVFSNLEVTGNYASVGGGGITNTTVSGLNRLNIVFRNAKINNNTAGSYGGGMFNTTANVELISAEVNGNSTQGFGGGLYNTTVSIVLKTVKVVGNYARGLSSTALTGGGMYNTTVHKQSFWNVLIANNVAEQGYGGGISNTTCYQNCEYVNTTIANNYAGSRGGGIFNTTARQTYRNTIVSGNRTSARENEDIYTEGLAGGSPTIYVSSFHYSLLRSSFGSPLLGTAYHPTINFPPTMESSLQESAQFVGPVAPSTTPSLTGNYHLVSESNPINAGNNLFIRPLSDYPWMEFDLDSADRIQEGIVDMGAYESVGDVSSCDGDIFVNDNATGSVHNGKSWDSAYLTLAEAIRENLTSACGFRIIHVAEGVYVPEDKLNSSSTDDREKTFGIAGINSMCLFGGYPDTVTGTNTLVRDPRTYHSILSGNLGNDMRSYHVVTLQNNEQVWIDGFHITNGQSDGLGENSNGAGIYNENSRLGLVTSEVYGNSAAGNGGGIAFYGEANESFIQNSRIYNNAANGNGSGIYADVTGGSVTVVNVEAYRNAAGGNGGGIADEGNSLHLINSSILYNEATSGGSAISVSETNTTDIHNSIIYGNTGTAVEGNFDYKASLVQDAVADGTNILSSEDPRFEDSASNNFSLEILSPALYTANAGLFQSIVSGEATDIDGINPRIVNNRIDAGARQNKHNLWVGGTENATTAWSADNNWTLGRVLDANEPLVFFIHAEDDLEMNGDSAVVSYIYNKTGKKLIVGNESYLKTDGEITLPDNNPGESLVIRGDKDTSGVVGSFIFTQGKEIPATVEFYSFEITPDTAKTVNDLVFQYMGIPVTSFPASSLTKGWVAKPEWFLRTYNETSTNKNIWWTPVDPSETLSPFIGYEIARKDMEGFNRDGVITYTGTLVTEDRTLPLTNSRNIPDRHPYVGMHVVSNPYTAGLSIQNGLEFGSNMEETVYLLVIKTQNEYNNVETGSSPYLAIPVEVDEPNVLPSAVASMQGFVVKILDGNVNPGSLTFHYEGVDKNVQLRSAQVKKQRPYTIVRLNNGSQLKDKAWIFLDEGTTPGFDNGYDGSKIFGDQHLAQLYVTADDHKLQVATVPDLHTLTLGFKPEAGTTDYTLYFDHNRPLSDAYPELYLYDTETGAVTDISAPGAAYSFTAGDSSLPASNRFRLQTRVSTDLNQPTVSGVDIQYRNGRIEVENNTDAGLTVSVIDIAGRLVASSFVEANGTLLLDKQFPHGIYIINVVGDNLRMAKKIALSE